mmetsp:Transcript_42000/g.75667  ORF Transcript_42000/g.75667 Transcript_42000/m.75667 type:complete len:286 (+) Transcript_42000:83-940(+)
MHRLAHQPLSLLMLSIVLASSNAFLAPGNRQNLVAPSYTVESSLVRRTVLPPTALHQSSGGDEDGSSTINIALITTTIKDDIHDELQAALKNHPFCKMTGIQLSIADVPTTPAETAPWSKEHITHLQQADIACFENMSAVQSYLQKLDDDYLNVPKDISDDDRKKLPNKPDLVGDILDGSIESANTVLEGAAVPTTDSPLMAVCPNANTGRVCLKSGRWVANHIYYTKDTQKAVELKTERGQDGDVESGGEEVEEEEDIDIELWAESVVQAAGDVMERKAWGGGW